MSYNSYMKRLGFLLLLNILLVSLPVNAFSLPIPAQTLKVAQEAELKQASRTPSSQVVRVGIGDTGFKNYVYNKIGVFGTAETLICDNDRVIERIPADTNLNIKYNSDGSFLISEDDGTIIANIYGKIRILCPDGLLGVKGLKRAGKQALYHGVFEIVVAKEGYFNLVNLIEVEDYLKGVVPNEIRIRSIESTECCRKKLCTFSKS